MYSGKINCVYKAHVVPCCQFFCLILFLPLYNINYTEGANTLLIWQKARNILKCHKKKTEKLLEICGKGEKRELSLFFIFSFSAVKHMLRKTDSNRLMQFVLKYFHLQEFLNCGEDEFIRIILVNDLIQDFLIHCLLIHFKTDNCHSV